MMPGMPAVDFLPCHMVCPTATWTLAILIPAAANYLT